MVGFTLAVNCAVQEEVIGYVNGTRYGLAGSVWTSDLTQAHRSAIVIDRLID